MTLMTGLCGSLERRLLHRGEPAFDLDAAAMQHHDQVMGHDQSLEERRAQAQSFSRSKARQTHVAG